MYDLSEDNFKILQQVYLNLNGMTIDGGVNGTNFHLASYNMNGLGKIITELQKQGIKVDNRITGITKEILP